MTREEAQAQEISRQVEALLSGQQDAGADPLLDTARLLAESAPAAPSPVFAQQLRRRLLQAGSALADLAQERRPRMWKRFAAVSMAAMVILALAGVLWPHFSERGASAGARGGIHCRPAGADRVSGLHE